MVDRKNLISKSYNNLIKSYWFWADQFVMAGQVDNGELWLINNFINLKYNPDWFPGGIYFANKEYRDKMVEFCDCPYLQMQKYIVDEKKRFGNKDIIEIVLESISRGYFVIILVDRYYLDKGWKRGAEHQLMLHGYDVSNQIFYYADHTKSGEYRVGLTCTFEQMKHAFEASLTYEEAPEFKNSIFLFMPVSNETYKLNLKHIGIQLKAYYQGDQDLYDDFYKSGIKVYGDLALYFEHQLSSGMGIRDWRGLCVLLDHNSAMVYRIGYFEKCLNRTFGALEKYKEIEEECKKMVALYLKYIVKKDDKISNRIIAMLYQAGRNEEVAIKLLIKELE